MTNKMILFVDYYISNGFNATQAAISAGYSAKTANSSGQRLLTNVDIKRRLSKRIGEVLSNTDMAVLELINILDETIKSDIGDFANVETYIVVDKETGEEKRYKKVVFNDTAELNTRLLSEISETKDGAIKIKMYDKLKAVEMKGKFLELWQDGVTQFKKETKKESLTKEQRREKILQLNKELGNK